MKSKLFFFSTHLLVFLFYSFALTANNNFPYEFTVSESTYTPLENSISLNQGELWDDPDYEIPIGFSFSFFGETFDLAFISSEVSVGGNLDFKRSLSAKTTITGSNLDLIDRGTNAGASQSTISYLTEGEPGSRIFKIEWSNAGFFNDEDPNFSSFMNYQVWLFEGSNDIKIHYGPIAILSTAVYDESSGEQVVFSTNFDVFKALNGICEDNTWVLEGDPQNPSIADICEQFPFVPSMMGSPTENTEYNFTAKSMEMEVEESCDCLCRDSTALRAFINATEPETWGWDTTITYPNYIDFFGSDRVKIDANFCITKLNLEGFDIAGTLTSEIGGFEDLQILDLSNNQLTGTLPRELGSLMNLRELNLSNNQFSGGIPASLGGLTDLRILNLFDNELNGSIPPELGDLSQLRELNLTSNQLSGTIPVELGNLSNLDNLSMTSNLLTGSIPAELGNLSNLNALFLVDNQLTGLIPVELGQLFNLRTLALSSNQLSGNIPAELGDLSNLGSLTLSLNQLSGSIPAELGNLTELFTLSLSRNQLSGNIPPELGNLPLLIRFFMSNNLLSGSIPAELSGLESVRFISLFNNQLEGSIPATLGNLENLESLILTNNQLTGEMPTTLGNLTSLKRLLLSHNKLTGTIPTTLGNLENLERLILDNNQLSGTIPNEIGSIIRLRELELDTNQITGPIPNELGNLENLRELALNDNQLSDTLPASLSQLTFLQQLFVQNNQLSGCFPDALKSLCNIEEIDFSGNLDLANEGDFVAFCADDNGNCLTTSLHDFAGYQLNIFPNPATDYLIFEMNQAIELQIQLIDINGRIAIPVRTIQETSKLDISHLPKGLYIVQIQNKAWEAPIFDKIQVMK